MSRPAVARTVTTSHCIPEEPVISQSAVPALSYSSSSSSADEIEEPLRPRRASTKLISQNAADLKRLIGEPGTRLLEKCCGGGCCMAVQQQTDGLTFERVPVPDNEAF